MLFVRNAKAYAVLAILYDLIGDQIDKFTIETYLNGREEGFAICDKTYHKKVAFSEYRNNDSIVVYFGETVNFSLQGNSPDEKTYKNSKSFEYNQYLNAAEFIQNYLFIQNYFSDEITF